jgi:PAS domain S-box-containing protein
MVKSILKFQLQTFMNRPQHNKNLLRLIEELEDYSLLFMDLNGQIQTWNLGAQKILGYEENEIIGQNFRCFYTKEDIRDQKPDRLLSEALHSGKAKDEGWRVRKDGSTFWSIVSITAVHDQKQNVVGFGKLTHDLTTVKLAEKVLLEKNKELEQFNFIASHDLQEPLRTVMNFVTILKNEYSDKLDAEGRSFLDITLNATQRMKGLIHSLLSYSQLAKHPESVEIDCNTLVLSAVENLSALIINTGAVIHIDTLPVVYGYESELRQLFQNLIHNAIKFRKPDISPYINVGCQTFSDRVAFTISDNGIGIEDNYIDRIFLMFQKLHSSSDSDGYGIGLAFAKKIVSMHGGTISVQSTPGLGSAFTFTLFNHPT